MKNYDISKFLGAALLSTLIIVLVIMCSRIEEPTQFEAPQEPSQLSKLREGSILGERDMSQYKSSLEKLARGLALVLSDKSYRSRLKEEIDQADNPEQILYLHEFLQRNKDIAQTMVAKAVAANLKLDSSNKVLELAQPISAEMDIYFPVKAHREQWKPEDPVLVAIDPIWLREDQLTEITAYAENGERVSLSIEDPPEQPTLIIAPCNHPTDHQVFESNLDLSESIEAKRDLIPGPRAVKLKYICIEWFEVKRDFEEYWWMGNMEIDFFLRDNPTGDPENKNWLKKPNGDYVCCTFWSVPEDSRYEVCEEFFWWNWFLYKLADHGGSYTKLDVVILEDDWTEGEPDNPWDPQPYYNDDVVAIFYGVWRGNQGEMSEWGADASFKAGMLSDPYPPVPECWWQEE